MIFTYDIGFLLSQSNALTMSYKCKFYLFLKVKVSNYWEAIGVVAAHKAGVDPNSLRRDKIKNINTNSLIPSNACVASTSRIFA